MSPFKLKSLFDKAGITIKYMWETRYSDPEILHLNKVVNDLIKIDVQIASLTNGYFLVTDYGHIEVRYNEISIIIQQINDYGHSAPVGYTRILPTPINMLDTSIIIESLRFFREQIYK